MSDTLDRPTVRQPDWWCSAEFRYPGEYALSATTWGEESIIVTTDAVYRGRPDEQVGFVMEMIARR